MAIKIPLSPLEEEERHSLTQLAVNRATLCARCAGARENAS